MALDGPAVGMSQEEFYRSVDRADRFFHPNLLLLESMSANS